MSSLYGLFAYTLPIMLVAKQDYQVGVLFLYPYRKLYVSGFKYGTSDITVHCILQR